MTAKTRLVCEKEKSRVFRSSIFLPSYILNDVVGIATDGLSVAVGNFGLGFSTHLGGSPFDFHSVDL